MKLGKNINGRLYLIEVENGHEINGDRTERQLYYEGYKKACEYQGDATETEWIEYPTCWVEIEKVSVKEIMEETENE